MASKKPSKTELVAICKLEFYRKQKNWKFCAQERKTKDSKRRNKATNAKINQTYNIAPAPMEAEPPDPEIPEPEEQQNLDEAFVETETGTSEPDEPALEAQLLKDTKTEKPIQLEPPGSPYSPRWSIQRWAEQHHLWDPEPSSPTLNPPCPTFDPPCPAFDPTCPTFDPTCPTRATQEVTPQNANCPIFDNNYNTIQQGIYNQTTQIYPKHLEQFDPKYGASLYYYNSNMFNDLRYIEGSAPNFCQSGIQPILSQGVDGGEWDEWCAGEGALWTEPELLAEAAALGDMEAGPGGEDALDGNWRDDLVNTSGVSQCDSLISVASSEFIRGAALAPHSTQIDLSLGAEPAQLPARALAAAVARHAAALRDLLRETRRRQQEAQADFCHDEIPVRDPGPSHHLPPRTFNDPIVAGSRTIPDVKGQTGQSVAQGQDGGRGRGRVKVGIRMGRPYRV